MEVDNRVMKLPVMPDEETNYKAVFYNFPYR